VSAGAERFAVRVMVTPVWDQVFLPVDAGTSVAQLKREDGSNGCGGEAERGENDPAVRHRAHGSLRIIAARP